MKKAQTQEITVASKNSLEELIKKLRMTKGFNEADRLEKMIRTAQALENAGFNNQANDAYKKAIEASMGNAIISRLYGVFLEKQGLWALAAKYF